MIEFTKMTALGNDYVYINCLNKDVNLSSKEIQQMSDRHFGIGSDGVIFIRKSNKSNTFIMDMYNSDGSSSDMCGNALRSIAKYLFDNSIIKENIVNIETKAGIYPVKIHIKNNKAFEMEANIGTPIFEPEKIPIKDYQEPVINKKITIDKREFTFSSVSIGNPHCVIFLNEDDDLESFEVEKYGSKIENHPLFPERTNVEFIKIHSKNEISQRTWERGSGETYACASGASAVLAVGIKSGRLNNEIINHLKGGDLKLIWNEKEKRIIQIGKANIVFSGLWLYNINEW